MTLTIHRTAVARAIAMLNAAGAEYAVIFDGETHGNLEVKPTSQRKPRYPRGATRAHYLPHLETLAPGDSAVVPVGPFDPATLAANISAYCYHTWGAGAGMTARNDEAGTIEVLRLF